MSDDLMKLAEEVLYLYACGPIEGFTEVTVISAAPTLARAVLDLRERVATTERERDAYRKAKSENDERFMLERDEARRERDTLRRLAGDLLDTMTAADKDRASGGDIWECRQALRSALGGGK